MNNSFIVFILLSLCSCSIPVSPGTPSPSPFSSKFSSKSDSYLTVLQIKSSETTNDGTPFYILLKSSNFEEFLVDDYDKISSLVSTANETDEGLKTICVIPGKTKKIKIESHKDRTTAVYFLFTKADERWKFMIEDEGCRNVSIMLGQHEISSIEMW